MMNYVQTIGLNKLFTDNTFTEFTSDAKASGVTPDSIIYITCLGDAALFGEEFKDGETFIWAKGNFYGGPSITDEYILSLFADYGSVNEVLNYNEITNIVNNIIKI